MIKNLTNLDSPCWDDLMVPITAAKQGISKIPDFTVFMTNTAGTSQGVFTYWFDPANEEELYFSVQMPHCWKGTAVRPHVHWTPKTTADGTPANQAVRWGVEYAWTDIGQVFANTSFVYGHAHTPAIGNVVARTHYLTPLTNITPSSTQDGLSSMMICRIFRDATNSAYDTYEHDAGLLQFDLHYEVDTLGSRQELVK